MKINVQNYLVEGISKKSNIDSVIQLLGITLVQVYNGKEQIVQEEIQSIQCEEKKSTGKLNLVAKACGEKGQIKERPDRHWNTGRLPSGRISPANFQFVK